MIAYENLRKITPDMVVLESIGTTISPMTGLSYAIMQDGKHYDPDTETYIGEIDVDEYMGTISNDDEITFMSLQDQEPMFGLPFAKGGVVSDSDYKTAYKLGVESYKSDKINAPAQDKKLLAFIFSNPNRNKVGNKETSELMDIWTKARYDENEKVMRKKFPEMYAKGGSVNDISQEFYNMNLDEIDGEGIDDIRKLKAIIYELNKRRSFAKGGIIGRKEWEKQVIKEIPNYSDYDINASENIIAGYPDYIEFLTYYQDGKTPKETAILVLDKLKR